MRLAHAENIRKPRPRPRCPERRRTHFDERANRRTRQQTENSRSPCDTFVHRLIVLFGAAARSVTTIRFGKKNNDIGCSHLRSRRTRTCREQAKLFCQELKIITIVGWRYYESCRPERNEENRIARTKQKTISRVFLPLFVRDRLRHECLSRKAGENTLFSLQKTYGDYVVGQEFRASRRRAEYLRKKKTKKREPKKNEQIFFFFLYVHLFLVSFKTLSMAF